MTSVRSRLLALLLFLSTVTLAHAVTYRSTEPFYNNDETRHVMTGVFVRDAILEGGWRRPREYAVEYYFHYPALGLLVWPPAFYIVEGAAMLVFGPSLVVAKALVVAFSLLGCFYLFLLIKMDHSAKLAYAAVFLFALSPFIFLFSRQVMLEIPTLGWVLASIYHFERYVRGGNSRDALLAGAAAALAALTRFDGVLLLAYFLVRLGACRTFGLLRDRSALAAIGIALALSAPIYWITWKEFGQGVALAAGQGTMPGSEPFHWRRNPSFYFLCLPKQVGWPILAASIVGGAACAIGGTCRRAGPFLALLAATYVTFTPLAELERRHTIYWIPAFCYFAALGVEAFVAAMHRPKWFSAAAGLLVVCTAVATTWQPAQFVRGYEAAAQYVVAQAGDEPAPVCLFDGFLNGGFIYYIRTHEPGRRWTVLRGDKLIYGMFSDPHVGYIEWEGTREKILGLLHRFDPEWIIVEEPQLFFGLPAADRLREVLHSLPDRFRLEREFPIETNHPQFSGGRLQVYRSLKRNPLREPLRELQMIGVGGAIRR